MNEDFESISEQNHFDIDQIVEYFLIKIEQIGSCKKKAFQWYIENLKKWRVKSNKELAFLYKIVSKICIAQLEYHQRVVALDVSYKVLPLLEIGGFALKNQDIDKMIQKINQKLKKDESLKNNHINKVMFILAQLYMQQRETEKAMDFLQELKINLDEKVEQQAKMLESVIKLEALIHFNENDKESLLQNVNKLKEFLKQKNDQDQNNIEQLESNIHYQIKKRKENIILFFEMFLDYIEQKQEEALKKVQKLSQEQCSENYLRLFYNLQMNENLSNIESLFCDLFHPQLFQLFSLLQQYENGQQDIEQKEFFKMKQVFEQYFKEQKDYQYGSGKQSMLRLIAATFLRINNQYQKSKENIQQIFKNCKIDFSSQLKNFFNYNLHLTNYCEHITNNQQPQFQNNEKIFNETNFSYLSEASINNISYILKVSKKKDYENYLKNEACLVLNSRYFLKIRNAFRNEKNQLVNVYAKQGKDLLQLKFQDIDELKKIYYIQQIIDGISLLHQKNIAHTDIKLNNILLKSDDDNKIVIIDFNISTINLFSLFYMPKGYNKHSSPKEQQYGQKCTLSADIFSLAKLIDDILLDKQNTKHKSNQLQNLIDNMKKAEQFQRCKIDFVQFQFRLHAFITILYRQLDSKKQQKYGYQVFYDCLCEMFTQFQYQTQNLILPKEKQKPYWNDQKQTINFEKIKKLLNKIKPNESYLDCLKEQKLKNFVQNILSEKEMKELNKEIVNQSLKDRQEDNKQQESILNQNITQNFDNKEEQEDQNQLSQETHEESITIFDFKDVEDNNIDNNQNFKLETEKLEEYIMKTLEEFSKFPFEDITNQSIQNNYQSIDQNAHQEIQQINDDTSNQNNHNFQQEGNQPQFTLSNFSNSFQDINQTLNRNHKSVHLSTP
ncbi:hypothetical protein ABPG72_007101 [Tetrahymena utriculariae]